MIEIKSPRKCFPLSLIVVDAKADLQTKASNGHGHGHGGGGRLFQWQALEKEEFDSAISQWGTEGLKRDATLKHSYPDYKWVLAPLGHWN